METLVETIGEILEKPIEGHPSKEKEQRIKRLEEIVLIQAQYIDTLRSVNPDIIITIKQQI